jgi:hypothetical protein
MCCPTLISRLVVHVLSTIRTERHAFVAAVAYSTWTCGVGCGMASGKSFSTRGARRAAHGRRQGLAAQRRGGAAANTSPGPARAHRPQPPAASRGPAAGSFLFFVFSFSLGCCLGLGLGFGFICYLGLMGCFCFGFWGQSRHRARGTASRFADCQSSGQWPVSIDY